MRPMPLGYELCLATAGRKVPSGPDWLHEIKHDGYRMLVIRQNERVRLLSRTAPTERSDIRGSPRPR
jgi:ATP-dependent DNA ligase